MSESTLWCVIAAFLVCLELLSGSKHLLMLSLGAVAAAVVAGTGAPETQQLLAAALVGSLAVVLWHRRLLQRGAIAHDDDNSAGLSQLDLGEEVLVLRWSSNGTAHVSYRGTERRARHHGPLVPQAGAHRIRAIEYDFLVLEPI